MMLSTTSPKKQIPSNKTPIRFALVLVSLLATLNAGASTITVGVDLFVTERHRVFGTITLDPDLAVGTAISSSSLQYQYIGLDALGKTVYALPSLPNYSGGPYETALDWQLDGQNLFISRLDSSSSWIGWDILVDEIVGQRDATGYAFILGSGVNAHELAVYQAGGEDHVLLAPASGPDGPNGFLIGTVVPEPTSAVLLTLAMAPLLLRRRRNA